MLMEILFDLENRKYMSTQSQDHQDFVARQTAHDRITEELLYLMDGNNLPNRSVPKEHDFYASCGKGDCDGSCAYCCLAICKVCDLGEGALTTECPGIPSGSHADQIYRCEEDFIGGKWQRRPSPHSSNFGL